MASDSLGEGQTRFRELHGPIGVIRTLLLVAVPISGTLYVLNVHVYLGMPALWKEQYVGLFIAMLLAALFLSTPSTRGSKRTGVPWYDFAFALMSLVIGAYIVAVYPQKILEGLLVTPEKVILGAVLIILALEAARRLLGWIFVGLTSTFIFYGAYTYLFPGVLWGSGTAWPRLVTHLYLDPTSFLWMVGIAATLALTFILFGQAIFSFGGGKILGDFALSLMGRYRGGPAKVSVLASSLFGTMSGSAVSNIMVTGSITIPLMKRTGYQSHFAAAVEATASNGGMIMPPVLGIVAFIMADMIGVSYSTIAVAALVPAVLYYISLFIQVDMEAAKQGLRGLLREELPPIAPILRKGWTVVIPLLFLVYLLFVVKFSPSVAAAYATIFSFLVFPILKENRFQYWQHLLYVFKSTGEILLNVGALLICAGFIVAVTSISGLGTKFSIGLVTLGGQNVLLLLGIAAVASIVLGMGLPASASYVLVAVLVAPALVELGIPLLAAHLFVLYYANLALITPPVALGVFVAAPLAGASPIRTGFAAMRLAILAYVVPFLFVFSPALLLQGPVWRIVMEGATAVIGTLALGIALSGYFFRPLSWYGRLALAWGALLVFISIAMEPVSFGWTLKLVGLLFLIPIALWEWRQTTRHRS